MVLGQTAHFRALSLRNYYAKWCADSPIAQRLLAQRSRDSGQFRSLLDEETLGAASISAPIGLPATAKFLSLVNRLAFRMLGNSPSVEIQASCGWRSFVHKRGEGGCCRGHCKKWSSLTVNVDPTRAESVGPNSNICEAQDRVVTPPAASAISGIPRKARDPP